MQPNEIGGFNDEVRLVLKGNDIHVAESWDIVESILSQPATWTMTLGNSAIVADFIERYPKRSPFEMYIGGVLQISGHIDGVGAHGQATQVTIKGRDQLADLHDGGIENVRSFDNATMAQIVKAALGGVGLDPERLIDSNGHNRQAKAGVTILDEIGPPLPGSPILPSARVTETERQNKINESAHSFVRRHIDRAGLFLWATADGHFVLSQPNGRQKPAYRLIRRKNGRNEGANIEDFDFMDDATHRHASATVFARSGGRKHGRAKFSVTINDEEMRNLRYRTKIVYRDANVKNPLEGAYLVRRKLAEERRNGYQLSYTVAGHTLPAIGSGKRAIITPDTTVEVIDEVLGIEETMYIETVRRQRHQGTTTTMRLMRLKDLIFGGDP